MGHEEPQHSLPKSQQPGGHRDPHRSPSSAPILRKVDRPSGAPQTLQYSKSVHSSSASFHRADRRRADEMQDPKTIQTRNTFSLACRVEVNIRAKPERIWSLLTDAKDFPRWNSTVSGIEGQIREGEQLRVHVPGSNR